MNLLKFNVFGRLVIVTRANSGWQAFYGGTDGKRRPANDIVIPAHETEASLEQYLADLCHEWATEENASVTRID